MKWEDRYVEVDGISTHYVFAGSGHPVVLLHGLGASLAVWWENMAPFAERFSVYALDLPGHGDSGKPDIAYDMPSTVRFLASFLDSQGIDRVSLVGNSGGGMLAAAFASLHPDRLDRLVLVDAAGLGREMPVFLRLASLPIIGEILQTPKVRNTENLIKSVFYEPRVVQDALAGELMRVRNLPGAKEAVLKAVRQGVTLWGMRRELVLLPHLQRVKVPILLVWGREDRVIPVAHAYLAASMLPGARLHVIPFCGHWPQMERAQEFNRVVITFLDGGLAETACPA